MNRAQPDDIAIIERAGYRAVRYHNGVAYVDNTWLLLDRDGAPLLIGSHGRIAQRQADAVAEGLRRAAAEGDAVKTSLVHPPPPVDAAHLRRVVNWAVEPQPRHPLTAPAAAFTFTPVDGGAVDVRAPDPRRAQRASDALTDFGYRVTRRRLTTRVDAFTPRAADHVAALDDGWHQHECPCCGELFPTPTGAAGTMVDCIRCPWRGHPTPADSPVAQPGKDPDRWP